jgi:nitrogen fixation NifU-like protein
MAAKSPYDDLVMDHIRNARNYRVPDDADRQAYGSNPLCGDEVTVYLRMNAGRLDDAAFQCSCCGISMASASMMTESVTGRSAAEARSRARSMIELIKARADPAAREGDEMTSALLATVREFPARAGCALLPWITLEAALDDRPEATLAP